MGRNLSAGDIRKKYFEEDTYSQMNRTSFDVSEKR